MSSKNVLIGCFVKFDPLMGDEPYFSLLKELKSKFIEKITAKSEEIGKDCGVLLFRLDSDSSKYEDIFEALSYNFNCPIAIKFDETFFTENDNEFYLNDKKLEKTKIYSEYSCNLAIFTNDEYMLNYFKK